MVFISILLLIYNLTIIFPYITNIKTFSFLSIGLPSTGQSLGVTNKAKVPQAAAAGGGGPPKWWKKRRQLWLNYKTVEMQR
jgi:hypothetical protein